jgi:hypothetical protein
MGKREVEEEKTEMLIVSSAYRIHVSSNTQSSIFPKTSSV